MYTLGGGGPFWVKWRDNGNTKQITTVIFHKCAGLTGYLI